MTQMTQMTQLRRKHRRASMSALLLAFLIAVMPLSSIFAMAAETYGSWKEYQEAQGLNEFTWNQVTDAIDEVLTAAAAAYESGDTEQAASYVSIAKNRYWGDSGLKIQMQKNLPSANKKTAETDFMNLSNVIKKGGSADDFTTAKDVLVADLRLSANKLDGVEVEVEISEESETAATAVFAKGYCATWEEYTAAAGMPLAGRMMPMRGRCGGRNGKTRQLTRPPGASSADYVWRSVPIITERELFPGWRAWRPWPGFSPWTGTGRSGRTT